jgi:hypothetical protein
MNIEVLRHVRRMWSNPLVSYETNRRNQIKWVRAIRMLGNKWLLAQHVHRKEAE